MSCAGAQFSAAPRQVITWFHVLFNRSNIAGSEQPLHGFIYRHHRLLTAAAAAAEERRQGLVHASAKCHMKQIYCLNVRAQWIRLLIMMAIDLQYIYLCLTWDQCEKWHLISSHSEVTRVACCAWLHVSSEEH